MPIQILSTKLSVPPLRSRLVNRSRLFQKLDQGLEYGFALVSAPAGYGKSTLVSAWLKEKQHPGLWLSLDEKDNEIFRFLSYLGAAFAEVNPLANATLESALQFHQQSDVETLLTPFLNQLVQLASPLSIILDDYHFIQNHDIHQALTFLLEHRPPGLHIIIITRADPPLPLAKLRARSELVEIRQADLCFSTNEATAFLNHTMGLGISSEDVESLTARTEGWIVGLQMAGLSLRGREDISRFIRSFNGEDRFILDYLFEEVFQSQSEDVQDFLLKTSILKQLCVSLCDAVIQTGNSGTILQSLERNNMFLIPLDDRRKWFRYHYLFQDLLKGHLKQVLPENITLLHQRASAWHANENDLENAIDHAFAAGDFEIAAQLIERVIKQEEVLNKLVAIRAWMDKLPPRILESHPWLEVYRGWVDFETGLRETAEQHLDVLEKSLETVMDANDPQKHHIHGHIAVLRAYAAIGKEDISRALEMGKKALALLPEDDRMRSSAAVALGAAYWARGDVTQTEQAFRVAREAGLRISHIRGAPATTYIGIQQVKQGQLQAAVATFTDAWQLATLPNGTETPLAGFARVKLGDVLREQNNLALASDHLNKGMELCKQLGQVDVLVDAWACLGRYQLTTGDLDGTWESLQSADRLARQSMVDHWLLCWIDNLRVKAWLADGNLEAARTWAKNSGLLLEGPFSYQHDLHHQNLARVLVAEGSITGSEQSYRDAESLLEKLIAKARQAGWVHEEIRLRVMQALNYQAFEKKEEALQSLLEAATLAVPGRYIRVFLDDGKPIWRLLTSLAKTLANQVRLKKMTAQKQAMLQKYISELLSAFDADYGQSRPASPAVPKIESLVEPLSPRELEILKLLIQGCSDKQIADNLVIARETVHKHLKNIYGKLDVHSRAEAVVRARNLGML